MSQAECHYQIVWSVSVACVFRDIFKVFWTEHCPAVSLQTERMQTEDCDNHEDNETATS